MEEQNNQQPQAQSKTGIGVVCGIFLGLIGLIIGFCCFKEGSYERKTFFKGFWWAFGITMVIAVVMIIIVFVAYGALLGGMLAGA